MRPTLREAAPRLCGSFLFFLCSTYTNSINDCNTSLGKDAMNRDAMNRDAMNGLFVAFFFPIGIKYGLAHLHTELV
ncbi:hypothetical protein [Nostoc sphaeroides]|uniref:hypothetical protein n=1 Tax=Nostoc sphaeroides TaxID=446679 RepID=UPI0015F3151E|nr:hypothetical protein [Nostoc sphaeroides]